MRRPAGRRTLLLARAVTMAAVLALAAVGAGAGGVARAATPSPTGSAAAPTPLLAYYLLSYDQPSWDHNKSDVPSLGRYSSDDPVVMRQHVTWARSAGIDAFVVDWRNTPITNRRLKLLMGVAREQGLSLAMNYEGLDVNRKPFAADRVASDLGYFAATFAVDPVFMTLGGKPLTIWSGTPSYSHDDVARVMSSVRSRLEVLNTEKTPEGYQRIADVTDGNAYYWSSVNPESNGNYVTKLIAMSQAVHSRHQYWIAPFAPGFDQTQAGGQQSVDRRGGQTLRDEYAAAVKSSPDALGLISWNDFTENSYVEPSEKYGEQALDVLRSLRQAPPPVPTAAVDSSDSGAGSLGGLPSSFWPNVLMLGGFLVVLLIGGGLVGVAARRATRRRPGRGRRRADDPDLPPLKAEDVRVKW